MVKFVVEVGEPWFSSNRDLVKLTKHPKSPLDGAMRIYLKQAISGGSNPKHIEISRAVLGLPNPSFNSDPTGTGN
jgi:hypothetical protein